MALDKKFKGGMNMGTKFPSNLSGIVVDLCISMFPANVNLMLTLQEKSRDHQSH